MARFLVIYTGGTIGMKMGEQGLAPDRDTVIHALDGFKSQMDFDLHLCDPLIDSSAITLQHWFDLIELIRECHQQYMGVLVIHGTDTLAYTASILTFFLQDIAKKIVLTGAQYPLGHPNSDGLINLQRAIDVLIKTDIQDVLIVFGDKLLKGTDATKVDTVSYGAFDAVFESPLGIFSEEGLLLTDQNRLIQKPDDILAQPKKLNVQLKIATYILTPGINSTLIAHSLLNEPTHAAILLSFGNGNIPQSPVLIQAITQYTQTGRVLMNKSQVFKGVMNDVYAQSSALYQAGAKMAGNVTLEALMAKLLFELS
ncbi:asparaginase [Neisseria sp. Ec49-e6-T10]|uniref:asparaginase n=1 Tax=Neisseria sp. Ec49-e6-T10 TaxID=3140744 RepID=UPI003EBC939D